MTRYYLLACFCLSSVVWSWPNSSLAADYPIFDDGTLAIWARENPPGVVEPAVPVFDNGAPVGDYKLIEAYDQVFAGTGCFPLTVADIIANTYVRSTYQKADGTTGSLGTSIVGSVSYRTTAGLQFIPTVMRADVNTGGGERVEIILQGTFGADAAVTSTRTFPDPPLGNTQTRLTVRFQALQAIDLDASFLGSDAARLMTASTTFADESQYDANRLVFQDAAGDVQSFVFSNTTPRDTHLFPAAQEIGSWFMLDKDPGSTWNPGSPSMRIDILDHSAVPGRLGIQGFLAGTTNPNDDSLTVWLEWMDAPATILAGTTLEIELAISASGEWRLTQQQVDLFLNVLLGLDTAPDHVHWADLNCDTLTNGLDISWLVHGLLLP